MRFQGSWNGFAIGLFMSLKLTLTMSVQWWLQDKQAESPLVYTLRYALVYILFDHCHKGTYRRKEPLVKSWTQRGLSAFRRTTHWK
jgi:hypothetical protein